MLNDWDPQKNRQLTMGLCDKLGISRQELKARMLELFIREHLEGEEDPEKALREIRAAGIDRTKRTTKLYNFPRIFEQTHEEMKTSINEMATNKVLEFRDVMREHLTRENDAQTSSRCRAKILRKVIKLASTRITDIVTEQVM